MQSRLEDVLSQKERELKLHGKFVNLARFCEKEIFPFSDAPLKRHVEVLKGLVEMLMPEPKDRRQEMFSGEVFVLLCTLYLHDIGTAIKYGWTANREILSTIDAPPRTLVLLGELGRRLDLPDRTVELVGSLIFSIKKTPIEWEIAEGTTRAIVRNARVLSRIFDFAHLLWDLFSADSGHRALRRFQKAGLPSGWGRAELAIDSRQGIISIKCRPEVPYQVHVLARVRDYVETLFARFREAVNGRLGFQYRQIVWDIAEGQGVHVPELPGHFPFTVFQGLPYIRWEEASQLLDKLFRHGYAMVVGDGASGKTTMANSFVVPQLRHISPRVYYVEIWDHPVHEIKEALGEGQIIPQGGPVDIISACKRLVMEGPCFFILDGCERLKTLGADEGEKLERFIGFCLENENAYVIALGDKEEFFSWYKPFRRMSLEAVFEVSRLDRLGPRPAVQPVEIIPLEILREKVDEAVNAVADRRELRAVISVLSGSGEKALRRYTAADVCFETCIPHERVLQCLNLLQEKGIVRRQDVLRTIFWVLSGRQLKEHLCAYLGLDEFAYKAALRDVLSHAGSKGLLLDGETLDRIEDAQGDMMFTKREMGLVLASMVHHGRDWSNLLAKAEREVRGFDSEAVLSLLGRDDALIREGAIRLLAKVKDDALINPLLTHLRRETEPALRALLVKGFIVIGKRRTIVALMNTLTEMGDRHAKMKVIDYISRLPARAARAFLFEIADVEKDPEMIDEIDLRLSRIEE
ncbi:MAG: hypothetical protein ABSC19_12625 [Syntrophorhabdales bacterium]|jgi:hypothetical protein